MLSTLTTLSALALTLVSAAPATDTPTPYQPKIYVAAAGPGVGLHSTTGTRQDFRTSGPAIATFDNFNDAEVAFDPFLVAVTYPDGRVKGGVKVSPLFMDAPCRASETDAVVHPFLARVSDRRRHVCHPGCSWHRGTFWPGGWHREHLVVRLLAERMIGMLGGKTGAPACVNMLD